MPLLDPQPVVNLCPPRVVVDIAHQVMGQIDLDAWASPHSALITQASRGYDHTQYDVDAICAMDWNAGTQGRTLVAVPSGTANAKRLACKALREYRAGRVQEALLWLGPNESLIGLPWLWDQLVCIPWRRLRPLAWHLDLQQFYPVSSGSWSLIAYLPPVTPYQLRQERIARFHVCAAPIGRVVVDEAAGDSDWAQAYASTYGRDYNYTPS